MRFTEADSVLLLDACSLLNLYASRHLGEILKTLPARFAVVERVMCETLYVQRGGTGEDADKRDPVEIAPLIEQCLLRVLSFETEQEMTVFLEFATQLDDGEAMTCALAYIHGYDVVTDDKKALRLLGRHASHLVRYGTLDVLQAWADEGDVSDMILRTTLKDIRERASYFPGTSHPRYSWWANLLAP